MTDNSWVRVLIPGLASGEDEQGVLAFLGILLPVGPSSWCRCCAAWAIEHPWPTSPGRWLAIGFAVVSLIVLGLVRTGLVMLSD